MNTKKTKTKSADRMTSLTNLVNEQLKERAITIPTPGQIKAILKEQYRKRVDYAVARNIQSRLKRADKKTKANKPAVTISVEEQPKPTGQLRHTVSHGNW